MTYIVKVNNLQKQYGHSKVVDGVTFSVKTGEVFGLLGPNGAGKTTTMEMIEALRPIDGGTASIDGIDVAKYPDKIKAIIGIQLQSTQFLDRLNLTDLLRMFGGMYSTSVNPIELLSEVQLTEKAKSQVSQLSGGQKQRFSIAAALVNQPKVLFLDEPTTGLDPQARRNLWDLIEQIKQKDITVVMTTHYMEEAELLCDRVAIMDNGRVVAMDEPDRLIDSLIDRGFKKDPVKRDKTVRLATLEDVFIDLTGKELREG